jgi:excisionase family DNA binding protein
VVNPVADAVAHRCPGCDGTVTTLSNIKEAAAVLGIPMTTLRDMVTKRRVPHTFVGKHARFTPHHIHEIIQAGEQPVLSGRAA